MCMNLDLQFFTTLFFSLLDFTGLTLLALTIYRIPILMYWKRLVTIQFVLVAVTQAHELILGNRDFYALTIACVGIILLTILMRIPFLYSSLIWGTGYLLAVLIQTVIVIAITLFGFSLQDMKSSPIFANIGVVIFFLVVLLIVYFMDRKRMGFMFIMNRFRLQKREIKLKDYFIAIFFICTVSLIQFGIVSYTTKELNTNLFIVLGSMIIIALIGLYITYMFNMREIDERFSSLRNNKK